MDFERSIIWGALFPPLSKLEDIFEGCFRLGLGPVFRCYCLRVLQTHLPEHDTLDNQEPVVNM